MSKTKQVNLLTSRAVTPAVGALKTVFDHVHLITVMQPEFVTGTYCFMVASKGVDTRRAPVAWDKWKEKGLATKYYNQDMHSAAFAMPVRTCFTGTKVLACWYKSANSDA